MRNRGGKNETGETQLGAYAVIVKEAQGGESKKGPRVAEDEEKKLEVLLVKDSSQTPTVPEVSAGFAKWSNPEGTLSFPGGMRLVEADELQTLEQVLQKSLHEATGFLVSLEVLSKGIPQDFPFLSGELYSEEKIQQVATTSALFYLDQLVADHQEYIEQKIEEGKATWYSLKQIATALNPDTLRESQSVEGDSQKLFFRQHVYTIAYLWYLQFIQNLPGLTILPKVNELNKTTHDFMGEESRIRKLPIKSSIFGNRGNVALPYTLEPTNFKFLYKNPSPTSK